MKKCFVCLILITLMLTGCGTSEMLPETTEAPQLVQLANPWVSYDTLDEAEKAAGFSLSMRSEIGAFRAETFRVMNGQLLEACYRDGDFAVTVRKQPGEGQDISGVFESFEKETVYETGDSWVIGRFSEVGSLYLIDSGGYSWSIYAPNGYPGDIHERFLNAVLGDPDD